MNRLYDIIGIDNIDNINVTYSRPDDKILLFSRDFTCVVLADMIYYTQIKVEFLRRIENEIS